MKRDMDLVRAILLAIEAAPGPMVDGYLEIEGYDDSVVHHHLHLLMEAEYVHALVFNDVSLSFGMVQDASLTWSGHEFIDTIRDPEIWSRAKAGAKRAGSWSFSVISEIAKGMVRQKAIELGLLIGP